MIRIVSTADITPMLNSLGPDRDHVMRHGQVVQTARHESQANKTVYYDILLDTDLAEFPPGMQIALINRPQVIYVGEWDMVPDELDKDGNVIVAHSRVLKGVDPGVSGFLGWPV